NWIVWLGIAGFCAWRLRKTVLTTVPYWLLLAVCGAVLVVAVELFYLKDLNHQIHPPSFRANTLFKIGIHSWILLTVAMVSALHDVTQRTWVCATLAAHSLVFPAVVILQFYGLF